MYFMQTHPAQPSLFSGWWSYFLLILRYVVYFKYLYDQLENLNLEKKHNFLP